MQVLVSQRAAEVAGGLADPVDCSVVDPELTPVCPVAIPPPEW